VTPRRGSGRGKGGRVDAGADLRGYRCHDVATERLLRDVYRDAPHVLDRRGDLALWAALFDELAVTVAKDEQSQQTQTIARRDAEMSYYRDEQTDAYFERSTKRRPIELEVVCARHIKMKIVHGHYPDQHEYVVEFHLSEQAGIKVRCLGFPAGAAHLPESPRPPRDNADARETARHYVGRAVSLLGGFRYPAA
jgi:hypothetical protein